MSKFAVLLLLFLPLDPATSSTQPTLALESPPHYQSHHWYEPFTLQISHWPAISKWNLEYFATTFVQRGKVRVGTMPRRNARSRSTSISSSGTRINTVPYSLSIVESQSTLNFSAACRLILNSSNSDHVHYIYQLSLSSLLSEAQWIGGDILRPDINFGELRPLETRPPDLQLTNVSVASFQVPRKLNRHFEESFIWIGSNGTRSGLHFDVSDNFHVVVKGSKTVVLFPPSDAPYLYPLGDVPVQSQLDPLHSNVLVDFPLFAHARPQIVHLLPGDTLFIPRLWWHWVESTAITVSVNWWHFPPVWWRHMYNNKKTNKARQKELLTEYLDEFRYIHVNPKMTERFHHAVGDAGMCRSWYAVAKGFVQRILTGQSSSYWRSMNQPQTLVERGAAFAEMLMEDGMLARVEKGEKDGDDGAGDDDGTRCRDDDPILKYMTEFRIKFRDGVVRSLLDKLSTGTLEEDDLRVSLISSVALVKTFEPRPTKECHFENLFRVDGGGEAWRHCEVLAAVDKKKRKEMTMEEL